MLCSHQDVQVHARAVEISPVSATTHEQLQELEYDLTVIESVLSILLGSIMSVEGEKGYKTDCLLSRTLFDGHTKSVVKSGPCV